MSLAPLVISRRLALKTTTAAALGTALLGVALAKSTADAQLLTISDLHAPYARLPALLEAFKDLRDSAQVP